jgi:CubicO group peptidase (beta-lactamase class C family)
VYPVAKLEAYLRGLNLEKPEQPVRRPSSLGFALLGYALERATHIPFADLLRTELLEPCGLSHTALAVPSQEIADMAPGHRQSGRPAPRWMHATFAPGSGLFSTVADQLRWIQLLLEDPRRRIPQQLNADDINPRFDLGFVVDSSCGRLYRQGNTNGFSSYIGFTPEKALGLVVLANRRNPPLLNAIARNCERALRGLPLTPLTGNYGKPAALFLDKVRNRKNRTRVLENIWHDLRSA